jgi:formylglycine-generating enzyme required for sulfatase activity
MPPREARALGTVAFAIMVSLTHTARSAEFCAVGNFGESGPCFPDLQVCRNYAEPSGGTCVLRQSASPTSRPAPGSAEEAYEAGRGLGIIFRALTEGDKEKSDLTQQERSRRQESGRFNEDPPRQEGGQQQGLGLRAIEAKCTEIGFTKGTEKYGECVVEFLKATPQGYAIQANTSEDSAKASAEIREPVMVTIPAGSFTMGSSAKSNEKPEHTVTIRKPFAIGKYEITYAEYDAFCDATGRSRPVDVFNWGRGNHPVTMISWADAADYALWLREKTGQRYRLPSEAEWEYSARAGSTAKYPWSEEIGVNNANCDGCGSPWDSRQTAPVGSFAANAFGLHDSIGNVGEFVQDCYQANYRGAPTDGSARTQCKSTPLCLLSNDGCSPALIRGGSYIFKPRSVTNRDTVSQGVQLWWVGFRVAQDLQ